MSTYIYTGGKRYPLDGEERTLPESLLSKKSMVNDSISIHIGNISLQDLRLEKEVLAIPTVF
jgi:hypothetical protein